MTKQVTILTGDPTVIPIAHMQLRPQGIEEMMEWVASHRPECLPDMEEGQQYNWKQLFPHDLTEVLTPSNPETLVTQVRGLTDNELLVELAGRKCYDSFGLKAGKKSNKEYIANTQQGDVPHGSIMYHAKMSFFIAGVSRRVSHELIRHYVGADRDEEGSPSQESTRFTHHYGSYIAHPFILAPHLNDNDRIRGEVEEFRRAMQGNYDAYLGYVEGHFSAYRDVHGTDPKGLDRKRIYESASPYLSHSCETSFIWTTNPIAMAKLLKERDNDAADLEFARLAKKWKRICLDFWPNLFPQPWMKPETK